MFKVCVLFVSLFMRNIKATSEVPHHPSPDLSETAPFLPRAILSYSYKFPLRDDGSLVAFSEKYRNRGEKIVKAEDLTQMLYPRSKFSNVEDKIKQYIGVRDTPFWRDAPLHHMLDMNTDLDGAMTAWMAEPAFTKTSYIGEQDGNHDFYGTIIKQFYEPFGFPFEISGLEIGMCLIMFYATQLTRLEEKK
ncbi:hypothetical protein RB195_003894 [Necator americanus]|uniref:Uncharacterized protein n=1 Tax=Necator americanus TaxID=51031 RepID=A0ABR1DR75_NECAM